MAKYYQVHGTVSSTTSIDYHFVCEKCGNDSGILTKGLKDTHELNATNVTVENTNNGLRISEESMNEAKKLTSSGANYKKIDIWDRVVHKKIYYDFKDKCPHCHKHQSWNKFYLYWFREIIGNTVGFTIGIAIIGALAIMGGKTTLEFYKSIGIHSFWKYMLYSLILGILLSLILVLICFIIYKIRIIGNIKRNIPIIDWKDDELNKKSEDIET
jgi:hypothetical protein